MEEKEHVQKQIHWLRVSVCVYTAGKYAKIAAKELSVLANQSPRDNEFLQGVSIWSNYRLSPQVSATTALRPIFWKRRLQRACYS